MDESREGGKGGIGRQGRGTGRKGVGGAVLGGETCCTVHMRKEWLEKFSKVSALVYSLYLIPVERTFEILCV